MPATVTESVAIAPNGRVFDLPAIVGIEEGIFERHGLDVTFSAGYEQRPRTARDMFARLKESLFELGQSDVYSVCEWASLDRLERGSRPGQEPFISLALKNGAHIVASTFYRGAEIVGANLSPEVRERYLEAVNEAVDHINAHPGAYRGHLVEQALGALAPEELSTAFHRYIHVTPYPRQRLEETSNWMRSWDLAAGDWRPDTLVDVQ